MACCTDLPNPDILLSPLTTQEAVLSSKIEGTQATFGEVLEFEAAEPAATAPEVLDTGGPKLQDIQEILNYRRALRRAEEELKTRPFNLNLLLELHDILLDSVRGRNMGRGHFRRTQNWIGAANSTIEQARFVPPAPEHISDFIGNWEHYYHMDRPDALVQLAIVHAQFELIHPFNDGNGRLGRILIPLFLYEKQILSQPVFYLSGYLEQHRATYIERLRGLNSDGEGWGAWIEFFLGGLIEQGHANVTIARKILDLYDRMKLKVMQATHSKFAVPLLDSFFERPMLTAREIETRPGMPSKQMIMTLLAKLRQAGILRVVREQSGRRAGILAFAELINLCEGRDVFAAKGARRKRATV